MSTVSLSHPADEQRWQQRGDEDAQLAGLSSDTDDDEDEEEEDDWDEMSEAGDSDAAAVCGHECSSLSLSSRLHTPWQRRVRRDLEEAALLSPPFCWAEARPGGGGHKVTLRLCLPLSSITSNPHALQRHWSLPPEGSLLLELRLFPPVYPSAVTDMTVSVGQCRLSSDGSSDVSLFSE